MEGARNFSSVRDDGRCRGGSIMGFRCRSRPLHAWPPSRWPPCLAACSPTFNWREVPIGDDGAGRAAALQARPRHARRCRSAPSPWRWTWPAAKPAAPPSRWPTPPPATRRRPRPGCAPGARPRVRSWAARPVAEAAAVLPRAAAAPAPVRLDAPRRPRAGGQGAARALVCPAACRQGRALPGHRARTALFAGGAADLLRGLARSLSPPRIIDRPSPIHA